MARQLARELVAIDQKSAGGIHLQVWQVSFQPFFALQVLRRVQVKRAQHAARKRESLYNRTNPSHALTSSTGLHSPTAHEGPTPSAEKTTQPAETA
eukprot:2058116-Amphidinium_carterae.1